MKKLLAVFLLTTMVLACVEAQTKTYVGSTITVTWDAPPLGTIPPAEIAYEVVLAPYPSGAVTVVGTVTAIEQAITFTVEGQYRIGVRTKRTLPGGDVLWSAYSWSSVEGAPAPWFAAFYKEPDKVLRVRIK